MTRGKNDVAKPGRIGLAPRTRPDFGAPSLWRVWQSSASFPTDESVRTLSPDCLGNYTGWGIADNRKGGGLAGRRRATGTEAQAGISTATTTSSPGRLPLSTLPVPPPYHPIDSLHSCRPSPALQHHSCSTFSDRPPTTNSASGTPQLTTRLFSRSD